MDGSILIYVEFGFHKLHKQEELACQEKKMLQTLKIENTEFIYLDILFIYFRFDTK